MRTSSWVLRTGSWKRIFCVGALALAALGPSPARAAARVPVSLTVASQREVLYSCALSVPRSSHGLAMFVEAKRVGCISSFTTYTGASGGTYVECIRRGLLSTCSGGYGGPIYVVADWHVSENAEHSNRYDVGGLGRLHNDAGDRFLFSLDWVCCYD